MPEVILNYWAILAAAIASMVIGALWYGPVFGKFWMTLSGVDPKKIEADKKNGMGKLYAINFVGSLFMSYVLANALIFASAYTNITGLGSGLMTGFFNWIGFVAPVTLGTVLWESKPWKLWFLNNGYYLLTLVIMATILAYWK